MARKSKNGSSNNNGDTKNVVNFQDYKKIASEKKEELSEEGFDEYTIFTDFDKEMAVEYLGKIFPEGIPDEFKNEKLNYFLMGVIDGDPQEVLESIEPGMFEDMDFEEQLEITLGELEAVMDVLEETAEELETLEQEKELMLLQIEKLEEENKKLKLKEKTSKKGKAK